MPEHQKQTEPSGIATRIRPSDGGNGSPGIAPDTVSSASYRQLEDLRDLPAGWNRYGAETPNPQALRWARLVLESSLRAHLEPTRVMPSVEGGVGIIFRRGGKYADIECYNTGEILGTLSDGTGNPEVFHVEASDAGVSNAVGRIGDYLEP